MILVEGLIKMIYKMAVDVNGIIVDGSINSYKAGDDGEIILEVVKIVLIILV